MKQLFIVLIFILSFSIQAQAQGEILTNSMIKTLTKVPLSPSAIISKIKTSRTQFNVTVDSIVSLKNAGVDPKVIDAMVAASTAENKSGITDNMKPHKPSIDKPIKPIKITREVNDRSR